MDRFSDIVEPKTQAEKGVSTPATRTTTQAARKDRSLLARQGAYTLHSRYDSKELTKAARGKFLDRFVDEVDPNRELPEAERQRRADYAKKAYMTALARKSAVARARRKGTL